MTIFKVKSLKDIYIEEPVLGGRLPMTFKGNEYLAEKDVDEFIVYGEGDRPLAVSWECLGEDQLFVKIKEDN